MRRGLVDWKVVSGADPFLRKKSKCTAEHSENPNYRKRTKSIAVYSTMTHEDMHRVNPKHRVTEERAKFLPLNRKLRMHFAMNACSHAMKRFGEVETEPVTAVPEKKKTKF